MTVQSSDDYSAVLSVEATRLRPLIIDGFCKAGGAAMGYYRAGFDVLGIDIEPQPNYPFEFVQGDVFSVLPWLLANRKPAAVHLSPPCHDHSALLSLQETGHGTGWMLVAARGLAQCLDVPYVIENVERAVMVNPITLCGSSFGLGVRRHRKFETSWAVGLTPPCNHGSQPAPVDVSGTGARRLGPRTGGKGGNSRKPRNLAEAREVMGIDWMTRIELSQAIPPRYTEWLGAQLLSEIGVAA